MSALKSLADGRQWLMRVVTLGSVLALISIGLVTVPALGTHLIPPVHPNISDLPNEGVLRLHLGDTDYFEFQIWNGSEYESTVPAQLQDIGPPIRCELKGSAAVDGPVAALSSVDGHNVGLNGDDVGLRKNGSRGTPCGQVDLSEGAISITLAGDLADKEMDYAEIDIEGKHDVAVSYQLYLGGVQVGGLQQAFNCEDDTDCGPDSSDGDNFRVIVADAVFDRIDLIVTSTEGGEFSINGGADGTEPGPLGDFLHTNDSLFHITDVENVTCNTAATPLGEEGGPQGTFFLANCGGATGKSIAFEADTANNEVTITNVGAGIPGAYTLETWTFLPVPTTAVLRYDDGDGEFLAQFCLIDPRNPDGITVPDGIDTDTVLPLNEQTMFDPNDRHTTCVVQETKTTLGQFDFGTGIEAEFILFSTGDASRSYR